MINFSKAEIKDLILSVLGIALIFSYPNFGSFPLFPCHSTISTEDVNNFVYPDPQHVMHLGKWDML